MRGRSEQFWSCVWNGKHVCSGKSVRIEASLRSPRPIGGLAALRTGSLAVQFYQERSVDRLCPIEPSVHIPVGLLTELRLCHAVPQCVTTTVY